MVRTQYKQYDTESTKQKEPYIKSIKEKPNIKSIKEKPKIKSTG